VIIWFRSLSPGHGLVERYNEAYAVSRAEALRWPTDWHTKSLPPTTEKDYE
jgi:hypothetical protein